MLLAQAGDEKAPELLAERWHHRILGHAARLVADGDAARDVAQEAWIAIARGLSRLRDPARFRAWAYRIVANKSRDWIRREQSRRGAYLKFAESARQESSRTHDDRLDALTRALVGLPEEQHAILAWFYLEDMSVREIADVLSIPEGTVKSRLFYAREALRASVEEEP